MASGWQTIYLRFPRRDVACNVYQRMPFTRPHLSMSRIVFRLLLGVSAALVLVTVLSLLLPAATQPTARLHPEATSLLQSTGGLADQPETLWLGYVFGLFVLGLMAVCAWIGLRKKDTGTPLTRWMMIGFGGYALVFTGLTLTYARYTGSADVPFFGGFPLPTAWMIYGMWFFPLILVGLYMAFFDRFVLTKDDLARFQELVDENRRQEGAA